MISITPIGWVLFLVGPSLMVCRPRWLYVLAIFFLPFTATAVINVGSGRSASGIQASMFLASLLMTRYAGDWLMRLRVPLPSYGRWPLAWLGSFVAVAAVSLAMPLWINGRLQVPTANLLDFTTQPLYLRSSNITGVLYLVYGYFLSVLVASETRKQKMLLLTQRVFLASSVFTVLWGGIQLACSLAGVNYPASIFNTSENIAAKGYLEQLGGNAVQRIASVAVEPSIFAQCLLVAVPFTFPALLGKGHIFGKIGDRTIFVVILLMLLLTTSSTAYIGLVVTTVLTVGVMARWGRVSFKMVLWVATVAGLAGALYIAVPVAREIVSEAILTKGVSGSALERAVSIVNSLQVFVRYPVLGIGWASITSHDLIMNILANAGVIGFIAFFGSMIYIIRGLWRSIAYRQRNAINSEHIVLQDFATLVSFVTLLVTSIFAGFPNMFGYFWFMCGLAIAVPYSDMIVKAPAVLEGTSVA